MTEFRDEAEERALWRRWRAEGFAPIAAPDALTLASYAEGRLEPGAEAAVEEWLAAHPEAIEDIRAARAAKSSEVPDSLLVQAIALAVAMEPGAANVVRFPRPAAAARWRAAIAWSGLAASIVATSLIGFSLGNDAYLSLNATPAGDNTLQSLIDPPVGLFSGLGEDSGT
jgi:hypothetical protein